MLLSKSLRYFRRSLYLSDYGGLPATILKDWKNAISHGNQAPTDEPTVTQLTVGNVSAKYARLLFAEKSFSLH